MNILKYGPRFDFSTTLCDKTKPRAFRLVTRWLLLLGALLMLLVVAFFGGTFAHASSVAPPANAAAVPAPLIRFGWPLASPHPVLRRFEPPSTPYGPGHRGVDLGGLAGEPVFAAGDGLVLYAGPLADCDLVSIE